MAAETTPTFKAHRIGCADCTAGELCATGQALFDAARLGVPDYLVFAHHGVPYPGDRLVGALLGAEPELHRCDRCLQDLTASTQVAALRRRLSEVEAERDRAHRAAGDYFEVAAAAQGEVDLTFDSLAPLGVEFLDPPDGGDVPLHEQVRRVVSALATAHRQLADVETACFEVCPDNTAQALGEPDMPRFVCFNENADPLIETDTPADVIRQMRTRWDAVADQYATARRELAEARQAVEGLRDAADPLVECAAILEALHAAVVWELAPEIMAAIREVLPRVRAVLPRFAPRSSSGGTPE